MITAVVVTYNRRELLRRCIEHLRSQTCLLDNIIVVNNGSSDGTKEWMDEQADLEVIHQENVGGAGGFYRGIEYAFEKGYDWIWCMDDDVYPEADCLERLLKQDDAQTGILCPLRKQEGKWYRSEVKHFNLRNPFLHLHYYALEKEDWIGKDYVTIEGIAFEGPLIKREVVERIGLPNKELFLLYDDSDYSYRTVLAGYKVKFVTGAVLNKELFREKDDASQLIRKNKWKFYYHIRNSTYFNRKYGNNFFVCHLRPFGLFVKYECIVLRNILFNNKYELKDLWIFLHAYIDGIHEELGRRM